MLISSIMPRLIRQPSPGLFLVNEQNEEQRPRNSYSSSNYELTFSRYGYFLQSSLLPSLVRDIANYQLVLNCYVKRKKKLN